MKKNYLLLIIASVMFANFTFGQLSTRKNDSSIVKLGARPQSGDMALTFCFPLINDNFSLYKGNLLQPGDLLTFKKYNSNGVAYRIALKLYKQTDKSSGTVCDSSLLTPPFGDGIISNEINNSKREYCIAPGIEKHFSNSNIFDVYAAADLYVGLGRNVTVNDVKFKTNDYTDVKQVTNTSIFGLGGVVGFNIFIAHLPISLGLEYGLAAKWTLGGKTKETDDDVINKAAYNAVFYTQKTDALNNVDTHQYKSLKKGEFLMDTNHDVRIVLNIYFGR